MSSKPLYIGLPIPSYNTGDPSMILLHITSVVSKLRNRDTGLYEFGVSYGLGGRLHALEV